MRGVKPNTLSNYQFFLESLKQLPKEDCLLWPFAALEFGYGYVRVGERKRLMRTHRLAWEICVGPIPDGILVLHRCDIPPCYNPAHLFLGTTFDNIADKVAKGRSGIGERNSQAKITAEIVLEIRRRYVPWKVTQRELAREFGISQGAVSDIIIGKQWKHI